jgi:hypothetical protein
MSLIGLLILVIVVGLLLYLVQVLPLQAPFKTVALVLVVLIAIVWLLGGSGVVHLR